MSSRTAFAPSSSSLATAKGTRHPAAIPPDQNSPCKRTSALLELELKLIKSHGQMLAHAPRSPASAVPPSVSSPVPPHRPRATRRLASDTTTHVGVVAAASLCIHGQLVQPFWRSSERTATRYASHAQLGSVLGSGPGPLDGSGLWL